MPVSLSKNQTRKAAKAKARRGSLNGDGDADPFVSALSTVTMMIVMPSPPNDILPPPPRNLNPPNDPDRRNPSSDLDSDSDSYVAELPYLEFGITDVGVLASKP